jgi:uncharacterized membrane protein
MAYLLANPRLAFLEDYAMEWKEHLAWFAPVLLTAVASVIGRDRTGLLEETKIRRAMLVLLIIAFVAACISGLMGALVAKIAPVR